MRLFALLGCLVFLPFLRAEEKPVWIGHLPQDPGRVYAVGMVQLAATEAAALQQAGQQARVEVVARLRTSVKATTETRQTYHERMGSDQKTAGSGSRTFDQNTLIQTQAADLPGLTVAQTWTDPRERTVYALAYLDLVLAERELRARFHALPDPREESSALPPRERLRKLQRLRKTLSEVEALDDLAALLAAGGGDAALRGEVRQTKLRLQQRLEGLKAGLTFSARGLASQGLDQRLADGVRTAVLRLGLGWSEADPDFTLQLSFRVHHGNYEGIVSAWGTLEATLLDREGHAYEQTVLKAKGTSSSEALAEEALLREYRAQLGPALEQWLDHLFQG